MEFFFPRAINTFRFINDETLFSSWQSPTTGCLLYLGTLYFLKLFMKDQKAFKLHTFTLVHNWFLSLSSLVMLCGLIIAIVDKMNAIGWWDAYCKTGNSGPLAFWSYVFYLSKYYEWTDTILLSLKKKELLPLHVYHHCITLWISWAQLRTDSVNFYEPLLSNCLIHTLMYYYYAKRTMGQTVWWKRYLTVAQLAQFVFDLTCSLPKQYLVLSGRCQGSSVACTFGQLGVVSFFFLFSDFYKKTYGNESPLSPHDDKKKS